MATDTMATTATLGIVTDTETRPVHASLPLTYHPVPDIA